MSVRTNDRFGRPSTWLDTYQSTRTHSGGGGGEGGGQLAHNERKRTESNIITKRIKGMVK